MNVVSVGFRQEHGETICELTQQMTMENGVFLLNVEKDGHFTWQISNRCSRVALTWEIRMRAYET